MPPDYSRRPVPCYRWPKSDNRRHDLGEILISLGPGEPLDSPVDTLRGYVRDAELFKDHAGAGLL